MQHGLRKQGRPGSLGLAMRLRELSDRLLASATATEALEEWCQECGFSSGPITIERRKSGAAFFPDDEALDELKPERHERMAVRRVRLVRGSLGLSEADNWFILDRIPRETRRLLLVSDLPFGTAIRDLRPSRRTYFVRFASAPPEAGVSPDEYLANLEPSAPVLEHMAIVLDGEKRPLAAVSERYLASLLMQPEYAP